MASPRNRGGSGAQTSVRSGCVGLLRRPGKETWQWVRLRGATELLAGMSLLLSKHGFLSLADTSAMANEAFPGGPELDCTVDVILLFFSGIDPEGME